MGGTHSDVLKQIFGDWPKGEPEKDADPRREQAQKIVREILLFLYHEPVLDTFLYDGFLDGLTHFDRLLSYCNFLNAIRRAHVLVYERLNVVAKIEAVFFTEKMSSADEFRRTRINQNFEPISQNESYVFALREGLKYGLSRALALIDRPRLAPAAGSICDVNNLAAFDDADIDFVRNDLHKLNVKYADRFNVKDADIKTNGFSSAMEFVGRVSMFEVWKRADQLLYNPISDPVANRFRRILASQDLQILFVKALRANKQMFHIFRLGCGQASCLPERENLVFSLDVPAQQVPASHIAALLKPLESLAQSKGDGRK